MTEQWHDETPGLLVLPSGIRVRGRSLRAGVPPGQLPTLGIYLTARPTKAPPWEHRWIKWRDFWLPSDPDQAGRILHEAFKVATTRRVEVACGGGIGRTGTALAGLCVLDGLTPGAAVEHVRAHYAPRAVEVRWQRRFLQDLGQGRNEHPEPGKTSQD